MNFHVGPYTYAVAVSDRAIFDIEGNPLEGCAVPGRRLIALSFTLEPQRREEVLRHEYLHALEFHLPVPSNAEERAQWFAFAGQQFQTDFDAGGGRMALMRMAPRRLPDIGRAPLPDRRGDSTADTLCPPDRMTCGACGADVMCGSIINGQPAMLSTGQMHLERWFQCEGCAAVQVWREYCTADGLPLGHYISNPPPKLLRGQEAASWLAARGVTA